MLATPSAEVAVNPQCPLTLEQNEFVPQLIMHLYQLPKERPILSKQK
jgi:hypothetical protein